MGSARLGLGFKIIFNEVKTKKQQKEKTDDCTVNSSSTWWVGQLYIVLGIF